MIINILFLILAIFLSSILLLFYRKQKRIEQFIKDNELLRDKIHNFYIKFLEKGTKYSIPYPIYYINMDKDIERKEQILEDHNTYVDSKLIRITGVNGHLIENKKGDIIKYNEETLSFENYYPQLSKGEIGCCLSHLIAIYTAWKNNDEIAIICEDDISFCTTSVIPKFTDIIANAPIDWECLQLASITDFYHSIPSMKLQYIPRLYPEKGFWGCGCYIINRKAMEKILKIVKKNINDNLYLIRPIREATTLELNQYKILKPVINTKMYPMDGVADAYIYDLLLTYSTYPVLFIVNNSNINSTFHQDHTPYHLKTALINIKNIEDVYF